MGAVESASLALRALSRQPAIFLAAAAFGLLKVPIELTGYLHLSYVYWVLALLAFPCTPLLLSALYGVCDASLKRDRRLERTTDGGQVGHFPSGRPDLRDAWTGIKQGYASLLIANFLYATVQHLLLFAFTVLWLSAALVVMLFAGAALELSEGTLAGDVVLFAGLLALTVVAAVYVLVRFGLAFFLQLYRPAAVVGDRGPVEALVESIRLVRDNPRSVVGFVLIRAFVFLVLLMPGAIALIAFLVIEIAVFEALAEEGARHLLVGVAVLVYGLGVAQLGFLGTYRVAFYRELVDEETLSGPEPTPPDGRAAAGGPSSTHFGRRVSGASRNVPASRTGRLREDAQSRKDIRSRDDSRDSHSDFVFGQPLEPASRREGDDEARDLGGE